MAESGDKLDEDVLGGFEADFQRSKAELIQRFLLDQEELNKRFEEYTLTGPGDSVLKELPDFQLVEKEIDQLSTCSTAHGSDVALSDGEDFERTRSQPVAKKEGCDVAPKDQERHHRKGKKILKKKAVRPKTAMEARPFLERVRYNMSGQTDHLKSAPYKPSSNHSLQSERSSTSWNPHQFQSGLTHIEERFSVLTELSMTGRPMTSSTVRPASQFHLNQRKPKNVKVLKLPPLDPAVTGTTSHVNSRTRNSSLLSQEFLIAEGF